jgi:hypothetical protein
MTKDKAETKVHKSTRRGGDPFEAEYEATPVVELSLALPMHIFMGEVLDAARFTKDFWEPVPEGLAKRPGLRSAKKATFDIDIADELIDLHARAQQAHTQVILTAKLPESAEDLMTRGEELLEILTGALEWAFEDDVEDDKDAQLAEANARHDSVDSIDALAAALVDYAALAEEYIADVDGKLDFERAHIDEARKSAAELLAVAPQTPVSPETKAALEHRNKLIEMLKKRLNKVRKAAKLVFKKHPSIAQQVTSAYQRRARAALRRRKAKEPKE